MVNQIACLLLPVVLLTSACNAQNSKNLSDAELAERIHKELKAHHYDEAIRLATSALQENPSHGAIANQISLVYIERATYDSNDRQRWLALATQFADKAIAANPADDLSRFDAARAYESAGDLSASSSRCPFFDTAAKLFEQLATAAVTHSTDSKGESIDAPGLQSGGKQGLQRVRGKQMKAGCSHVHP